jgi:hypothetical protein
MPDAKELQSTLDYSRSPATTSSAAIDPVFNATSFTNEGGVLDWPWYWTSTTHATYTGTGASGVYLAFGRAGGWQKATPSATCYTLYDVHGAGAQRSDPKTSSGVVTTGTACSGGTAYGLGPQGDAQRASNYVRLVRDAGARSSSRPARIAQVPARWAAPISAEGLMPFWLPVGDQQLPWYCSPSPAAISPISIIAFRNAARSR